MAQHQHDDANADPGGKNDPGEGGEDRDIVGTEQEDLTAEDLKGDAREEDDRPADLPDPEADRIGDFA